MGIQPNIIVVRTEMPISQDMKDKIALFCDIDTKAVIECEDADNLYSIPLELQKQGLDKLVCEHMKLACKEAEMSEWKELVNKVSNLSQTITIGLVGKYVELPDAYISVVESLRHAGYAFDTDVKVKWINAEEVTENNIAELTSGTDGIIVPGGFGDRGVEGKIVATKYARENNIPFLGICLGMQVASIEYARNVLGLKALTQRKLIRQLNTRSLIFFLNRRMLRISEERFVSAFTLVSLKKARKPLKCIRMKWCTSATATAMSLTMNSDSKWKSKASYSQAQALMDALLKSSS